MELVSHQLEVFPVEHPRGVKSDLLNNEELVVYSPEPLCFGPGVYELNTRVKAEQPDNTVLFVKTPDKDLLNGNTMLKASIKDGDGEISGNGFLHLIVRVDRSYCVPKNYELCSIHSLYALPHMLYKTSLQ